MRKNTTFVAMAFKNRNSYGRQGDSIWTDGRIIYSYNTPILWRGDDGRLVLDRTQYSTTTSAHQNSLARYFDIPAADLNL